VPPIFKNKMELCIYIYIYIFFFFQVQVRERMPNVGDYGFPNASLRSQNGERISLQAGKSSHRQPSLFSLARARVCNPVRYVFLRRSRRSLSSIRYTRTPHALARVSDGRSSRAAATWSVYDTLTVPVMPDARLWRYYQ